MAEHDKTDNETARLEMDPETGLMREVPADEPQGSPGTLTAGPAAGSGGKASGTEHEDDSLSQVRQILVSPLTRKLEQRVGQLADRVHAALREVSDTSTGRLEELEARHREEIRRLEDSVAQLTRRQSELVQQVARLTVELQAHYVDRASLAAVLSEAATQIGDTGEEPPVNLGDDVDLDQLIEADSKG